MAQRFSSVILSAFRQLLLCSKLCEYNWQSLAVKPLLAKLAVITMLYPDDTVILFYLFKFLELSLHSARLIFYNHIITHPTESKEKKTITSCGRNARVIFYDYV